MVIIAKFTPQDAQRYARAFASKNNNSQESQESQKTETESPNNNSQENQKTASPTAATRSKTPSNLRPRRMTLKTIRGT